MATENEDFFDDEIVEEIRRHREAHAALFDYDIRRIVEDLQRKQGESGREVVNRSPRKPRLSQTK